MQESEKQHYDPKPFCHAFKDWDGQPTNVLVQQDANEFLTLFFQQLEGMLMGKVRAACTVSARCEVRGVCACACGAWPVLRSIDIDGFHNYKFQLKYFQFGSLSLL